MLTFALASKPCSEVDVYKRQAVKVHRGCYAVVEETLCVGCGKCARSCPVGCIEMKERVAV